MEILDSEQMRRVDRRTIRRMGVPGLVLMENAGIRTFDAIVALHPDLASMSVLVLCGGGNNGGDGLVVARHLAGRGVRPRVILAARRAALRGDARTNLRAAEGIGLKVEEVLTAGRWRKIASELGRFDLIVDALLGTGLRGPARGLAGRMIESLNLSGVPVVAVDIPSGLSGSSDQIPGPAVKAVATVTFCRPKIPHVLPPAMSHVGRLVVSDIGIPDAAVEAERSGLGLVERRMVAGLLAPRAPESHKGDFGHLLVVSGSRDRSGAAALLARGALRAGCGLVTAAIPEEAQPILAPQLAEMMTLPLPQTARGEVSREAVGRALDLARERDLVALGPGLGTSASTGEFVRSFVRSLDRPLVLDADGLNAFAGSLARGLSGAARPLILTPHPGEMARLAGVTTREVLADRVGAVRRFARSHRCWVVLKGHRTLIGSPGGEVLVNPSGNPGMATAGSGDVLTGVIAGFLAQTRDPRAACLLGVWLHGRAGDLAAERLGEGALVAGDLIEHLPGAIRDLAEPRA